MEANLHGGFRGLVSPRNIGAFETNVCESSHGTSSHFHLHSSSLEYTTSFQRADERNKILRQGITFLQKIQEKQNQAVPPKILQ